MSKMAILQKSLIICPLTEKMNLMEKHCFCNFRYWRRWHALWTADSSMEHLLLASQLLLSCVTCWTFCSFKIEISDKDCLSFHDTSLFCLVRQGCQHGTVESAMLKFNNLLGHWNLRIWWCNPFLPIWWWYHLNVLKLWKFFPPWGLECFWSTLYQEIITIL